jgi:hypothetical protein
MTKRDASDFVREEGADRFREQVDQEIGAQRKNKNGSGAAKPPRFQLKRFDEIQLSTVPNYLVKGILPRTGLTVVWGPPKCGKSFLCFDMAMHIALGWPYRDRRVIQGAVVYLALEGGGGFANRVEAWRQRHVIVGEPVPFHLLAESVDMVADHGKLIDVIRQAAVAPAVIFIDTLNRALVGDENRPDDMARFIRAADALRAAFGCAVVVVHHCGVAGGRPRGHSSLSGADDAQIAVERDKDGIISATIERAKDSLPGAPFGSRLEVVDLGTDDDGDPITSCVVIPAAAGTRAGIRLTANQTRFIDILSQAIADFPATAVERQGAAGVPDGVSAVTRDVLKKQCFAKGWLEEMESNKSRAKLSGMLNVLANKKLVDLTDRLVWLTSAAGAAGSSPQAHPAEKGSSRTVPAGTQAPQGVSIDTLRACGACAMPTGGEENLREEIPEWMRETPIGPTTPAGLTTAAFWALVNTYAAMAFEAADAAALERVNSSVRKRLTDRGLTPEEVEAALAAIRKAAPPH